MAKAFALFFCTHHHLRVLHVLKFLTVTSWLVDTYTWWTSTPRHVARRRHDGLTAARAPAASSPWPCVPVTCCTHLYVHSAHAKSCYYYTSLTCSTPARKRLSPATAACTSRLVNFHRHLQRLSNRPSCNKTWTERNS